MHQISPPESVTFVAGKVKLPLIEVLVGVLVKSGRGHRH